MTPAMLSARVTEYVNTEAPPPELPSQANHFGPHGRCWRTTDEAKPGKPYDDLCRNPAVSDLGLCGDHLAEMVAW